MTQAEARRLAPKLGGIATTIDVAAGRWEKSYVWCVVWVDAQGNSRNVTDVREAEALIHDKEQS